tara:strand:- start:31933 stop:32649 length:717 start_codon:yes stop_codon:yes gene_type:complete
MNPFPYRGRCSHPANSNAPALECKSLSVNYTKSNAPAIEGITLAVQPGERCALAGPNGAGKSTLLKAAAGLLPIDGGALSIFGHAPGVCQHQVAYLSQRSQIDWNFPINLRKLVLTGRYIHRGWFAKVNEEDEVSVHEALELLSLTDLADRQIGELSGGQQQRALLARTLVHGASLLLLDEPLNAVDTQTCQIIEATLDRLRTEKKTVIMATHDLDRLDNDFDRVLFLSEGKQVQAHS